jgi:hypothetical protein
MKLAGNGRDGWDGVSQPSRELIPTKLTSIRPVAGIYMEKIVSVLWSVVLQKGKGREAETYGSACGEQHVVDG